MKCYKYLGMSVLFFKNNRFSALFAEMGDSVIKVIVELDYVIYWVYDS